MKKLFPEKKMSRMGLLEFLDKKGFYIVLILCIAIVGATAVFVTTHNITSSNQDYNAEKIVPEESDDSSVVAVEEGADVQGPISTAAVSPEKKEDTGNIPKDVPKDTPKENKAVAQSNDKAVAQSSGTNKAAAKKEEKAPAKNDKAPAAKKSADNTKAVEDQKFIRPVMGGVTFVFAQDKLVYSKTLEEWRTHSGIDLAAERGEPVKAVADGVVTDIKNDPRFGITVLIDHGNGLKTVYANLASDDMVSPNQKVKQGDIIGCVGNTASFESAEQPHLHFEVLKNNKPVNPEDFLPQKSN